MSKNKDGVFSLLRKILAEQKKQTKMLEAIVSSQEQNGNTISNASIKSIDSSTI